MLNRVFILFFLLFNFVACSQNLTSSEKRDVDIFENAKESVVFISTSKKVIDYNTLTRYTIPRGSGSGFIWNKDGYIVTNYHVINGASSATVKLYNGKSYNAFLLCAYPRRDIAVLKINPIEVKLKPIKIGTSTNLKVGQSIYAIGNPYGLDWTMTKGIISALNRKVPSQDGYLMSGAIQTDAAINPGNSGGVMLNSSGELIGVNSAILSPSGGSVGIGFAISVDVAKRVVEQLIKYGKYTKPAIGIESDDRINRYLKHTIKVSGVAILGLIRGSDAYNKNLIPAKFYRDGTIDFGDIIVEVDGKKISSIEDLDDILDKKQIGDSVKLKILRGNKTIDVPIKLIGLDS